MGERTLIMGILNLTPDSFSDGGELSDVPSVVARAGAMIQHGADILDLGGESTRPGAAPVSQAEELARVLPALRAIRARWPDVPLSIDTFKPAVAEAAIRTGADIVNDVWGLLHGMDATARAEARQALAAGTMPGVTSPMADVVARLRCPVILMHNRPDRNYADFWTDMLADLRLSVAVAERAGIPRSQIGVDPGFGFAKSAEQNLETIKSLHRLVALGFPVLVGTSRKSTLGRVLGTRVDDRLEGTGATTVWSIQQGCAIVRVHDVASTKRFVVMADAIKAGLNAKLPELSADSSVNPAGAA
jgi:dihydropteroate synthase